MQSDNRPTATEYPDCRNILIFGDCGTGKSSLINLIAGQERALMSSGKACINFDIKSPWDYRIVLLDTVEFALYEYERCVLEGFRGENIHPDTVYQAYTTISKLERSGGISLLVFCMKGGRISLPMQHMYNLFVEVLCDRQVPVVIAVTHLEMYDWMESWWKDNEKDMKEYGLKCHGHACITTSRGYKNIFIDKYEQSREIIRKALLKYSGRVAWKEQKENWAKQAVRPWLAPRHRKQLDANELMRKLIKRCGFSVEDAALIAQKIEQSRRMDGDAPGEDETWIESED